MRLSIVAALFSALVSFPARADEASRTQVFGGFSVNCLRAPSSGASVYRGWNASAAYRVFWKVSAVADFSGYYGRENEVVDTSVHAFFFGPRVTLSKGRISPFVHVLFGSSRLRADSGGPVFTTSAFSLVAGGGVDVRVTRRWSVRAVEIDYVRTRFLNEVPDGGRVSAGVVFRFGK